MAFTTLTDKLNRKKRETRSLLRECPFKMASYVSSTIG